MELAKGSEFPLQADLDRFAGIRTAVGTGASAQSVNSAGTERSAALVPDGAQRAVVWRLEGRASAHGDDSGRDAAQGTCAG